MMHLPKVVAAALAVRQLGNLLPQNYCSPLCPTCRDQVTQFDGSVSSCVANSTFINSCGSCQQCILTYNMQYGETEESRKLEQGLISILNLCENTNVSTQVEALQSIASRMSVLGDIIASKTMLSASATPTAVPVMTITTPPTSTQTNAQYWTTGDPDDPAFKSMLATATWAPEYSSWKAIQSASLASARANATASYSAAATPSSQSIPTPLNTSWIAGPVVGSVLGMCTVFVVIFFTRRRQRLTAAHLAALKKELPDESRPTSMTAGKPQLHSECVEAKELDNCEVMAPVELPALEPVGSELSTPREERGNHDEWPMPLSPLPLLFAMSELRDERERADEVRHQTYYNP